MQIKIKDRNFKQKLFDDGYVTAKALDALTYRGWQDYYIDDFAWSLDSQPDRYGFYVLTMSDGQADYPTVHTVRLNLNVPHGLRLSDFKK